MGVRKNLGIQAITQTLGRGLGFIFFIIVARRLGASDFGLFSFALSIGMMVSILMDFGLDPLLVKWSARGEFHLVQTAIRIRLLLSAVIWIFFTLVIWFISASQLLLFTSIGLYFLLLINIQSHISCFRGIEKMHLETWVLSIQKIIAIVLVILFLKNKSGSAIAGVLLAGSVISALIVARRITSIHHLRFLAYLGGIRTGIREHFGLIFKEALPLFFVMIGWNLYFKIDMVLLKAFVTDEQIGYYATAYKLMEGINIFPSIILAALFPTLAKQSLNNPLQAKRIFFKALLLLIPASLVILSLTELGSSTLIYILFGSAYAPSVPILRILIISIVAIFPGYLVTQALIVYDKNVLYAGIALACAGLNIILNLILIPKLGAAGAAWATVITEASVTLMCLVVLYRMKFVNSKSNIAT